MHKLSPSKQDYLETILDLSKQGEAVRSIDVANTLGFSRASVSRAISQLKADGYILQEPYGLITLTEAGRAEAVAVRGRHDLIKNFLIRLGVGPETAEEDACRIEHIISAETLEKIRQRHESEQ